MMCGAMYLSGGCWVFDGRFFNRFGSGMSCADAGHRRSEATRHSGTRMEARGLSVISFPFNVTRLSIMNFFFRSLRAYSSHSFCSWSAVCWLRGDDDENRTTSPDEHASSEPDEFIESEIKVHAERARVGDSRGRRAIFGGNEDILLSRREWSAAKRTHQKHIRIICLRIYMKRQSISLLNHRTYSKPLLRCRQSAEAIATRAAETRERDKR